MEALARRISDAIELRSIIGGTSKRIEDEGDISTAFTLAIFLSNIPISRGGSTSVVIYDIHALQVGAICYFSLSTEIMN
ncbi:hypothetical protein R6Q57_022256 [Mikania cordata]